MRYDFICNDCASLFEVERKLDDVTPIVCAECESANVHKVWLQVPGIALHFSRGTGGPREDRVFMPSVERHFTKEQQKRRASKKKLAQGVVL